MELRILNLGLRLLRQQGLLGIGVDHERLELALG